MNQTVTTMKEFESELFRLRGGSSEFYCGSLLHLKFPQSTKERRTFSETQTTQDAPDNCQKTSDVLRRSSGGSLRNTRRRRVHQDGPVYHLVAGSFQPGIHRPCCFGRDVILILYWSKVAFWLKKVLQLHLEKVKKTNLHVAAKFWRTNHRPLCVFGAFFISLKSIKTMSLFALKKVLAGSCGSVQNLQLVTLSQEGFGTLFTLITRSIIYNL